MKIITSIKQSLVNLYFSIRTSWPVWFYILNNKPRKLLKSNPVELSLKEKEILENLQRDGIALTSLETLFPGENLLAKLQEYVSLNRQNAKSQSKKKFLKNFWDKKPLIDLENIFVKVSLSKPVLSIVNSYMQMFTKFRYFDLAITTPVGANDEQVYSQRWHRDPEEKRICKMFIYLNDVDENSGPFIYIPETQYGGKWGHLFPQKPPAGVYPPEEKLVKIFPPEKWKVMTGKAGSVIFCDTIGLHRGGYAKENERIMYTSLFAAPSYKHEEGYSRGESFEKNTSGKNLSKEALYAIKP